MSGTSLALKIGTLVIGAGIFLTLLKRIKGLKKFGFISLLYIVVIALLLSLPTLLLYSENTGELQWIIISQAFIIALGTLNVLLIKKILPWFEEQVFSMQILFLICILVFGYLFSNLSFTFFVSSKVQLVWTLSLLWFIVPILLNRAIDRLLEVPQKVYKTWQYPSAAVEDPSDEEMENPVVISFIFQKNSKSTDSTIFRAKAPVEMSLGRLFYFFINDYNSRHPEGIISYVDEENDPDKWIFFKRKSKYLKWKVALDPEDTISTCKIKENDVLICNRASKHKKIMENETTEQ